MITLGGELEGSPHDEINGTLFTKILLESFCSTYVNTLGIMKNLYSINVKTRGYLQCDKYLRDEELLLK